MDECLDDFDVKWCRDLIDSPDFTQVDLPNRRPPPPLDQFLTNTLFAETLMTKTTIRAWVVLKGREIRPGSSSPEFIVLLSLGTGLSGYKDIAHGGLSALIMDQTMNMCTSLTFGPNIVSAETWQKFKQSVKIPGIVLCRTVCTRVDGARIFLETTIEDGAGTVYCEGGGVCALRRKQPKVKI